MPMTDALLREFDQEIASTRKTLERVPEDKFDWAPHEKSGKMVWLAGHLANIPQWATLAVNAGQWDAMALLLDRFDDVRTVARTLPYVTGF